MKEKEQASVVMESKLFSDGTIEAKYNLPQVIGVIADSIESGSASVDKIITIISAAVVKARRTSHETNKIMDGINKSERDASQAEYTNENRIKDLTDLVSEQEKTIARMRNEAYELKIKAEKSK